MTFNRKGRLAWLGCLVVLLLCLQPGEERRLQAQPAEAYGLVDAVNTYRASLGLPRLATSGALMVAAQRHAEWMAANYRYSHTGAGGSSPQDRARAAGFTGSVRENVAGSTNATAGEAVFFWDQSYVHQVAMRQPLATHIGAGFAANSDQRLFVLLIGTMPSQAPQPTTQPIAGGTPAIDYTPPPGLVWSGSDQLYQGTHYDPVAPESAQQSAQAADQTGTQPVPTLVAYVMPFDQIQRAEPRSDGSIVHVVEAGQTAWAIAARYGVDLQEILTINHLSGSPILHPGEELIIHLGEGQSAPPAPTSVSSYRVQAGESLWIIAARFNHSVEELRAWNNLTPEDVIQPGEVLIVNPPAPPPTASLTPRLASSSAPTISPSSTSTSPYTPTTIPPTVGETPVISRVEVVQTQPPTLVQLTEPRVQHGGTSFAGVSLDSDAALLLFLAFSGVTALVTVMAAAALIWLVWKRRSA